MTADSKNKVLSCFSSPWWCIALALSSNTWRWRPALPALVQEFCCCDSMSSCRCVAPSVLLLLGYSGGCEACGCLESGSNSIFLPSWCVLMARFDP
jgi:hypothetical protein